jgi:signal transduction histidine kinase
LGTTSGRHLRHAPGRRLTLFLFSMAVPCLVLTALGVRIIVQQEELAEKHAADERRLQVSEFGRALSSRLEQIRGNPRDPAVALVATVADGRLILPWEVSLRAGSTGDPAFQPALLAAEREEFARRFGEAERLVRSAIRLARTPPDAAQASLVLARILTKSDRLDDAHEIYAALLTQPLDVVDEQGVPFAFYAADRLLQHASLRAADRERIRAAVSSARSTALPLVAWYQLRSVLTALGDQDKWIGSRIADTEQAMALQREFSGVQALLRTSNALWAPFGSPLWLVGGARGAGDAIVAVGADALVAGMPLSSTEAKAVELTGGGGTGERLSEEFPGLKVRFAAVTPASQGALRLQRAFYGGALALVLGVTLLGAVLLWRDVRRELRVAELRSQFVSSVSHELKTPLTAIRMFADTLRLGRGDAASRGEFLDTIVNESERLTRLLDNVLDFSKIEQGRKAYHLEPRPLSDVVRVAARAMAYPLEQHGFSLQLDIDDTIPAAKIDADALEQAILNLLTNAMKFSGDGRDIELRLTRVQDHGVISVRDHGVGIPPHEQSRIFEKFYRVQTPDNQRIPGTGLGLTLVDHIAKAHDGCVRVDSEPGRGSTFSIHVPLAVAS